MPGAPGKRSLNGTPAITFASQGCRGLMGRDGEGGFRTGFFHLSETLHFSLLRTSLHKFG